MRGIVMWNVKRLIFFVIVLMIVPTTVVFMLENQQLVTLVFFNWSAPELSVAGLMILTLLVGMVIGPIVASITRLRTKPKPPGVL